MRKLRDPMEQRVVKAGFPERVAAMVRQVPEGQVTTYGDIGTLLGSPRVARHVGWALAAMPADWKVPWHRVINSRGMVSGRGQGERAAVQEAMLRAEGIEFSATGRIKMKQFRWRFEGAVIPPDMPPE